MIAICQNISKYYYKSNIGENMSKKEDNKKKKEDNKKKKKKSVEENTNSKMVFIQDSDR